MHSFRGPNELGGPSEMTDKGSEDNVSEDMHTSPFGESFGRTM